MALLDSPLIKAMLDENLLIEKQMHDAYSRLMNEGDQADAAIVSELLEKNAKIREAVYANDQEGAIGATEACHRIIDQYPSLFDRIESWYETGPLAFPT